MVVVEMVERRRRRMMLGPGGGGRRLDGEGNMSVARKVVRGGPGVDSGEMDGLRRGDDPIGGGGGSRDGREAREAGRLAGERAG